MHIQRGDTIILLKDVTYTEVEREETDDQNTPRSKKGQVSRVLHVLPKKDQVIIEGVNYRKKTIRPTQENPRGGWVSKEMPIDVSNVMLYSQELDRGVRVRVVEQDGRKTRVCKKTGTEIPFPT